MSKLPNTVYADPHYRISFDTERSILGFHWLPEHVEMSYVDFQEACSNYVGYAFEFGTQHYLIDVRDFRLQLPPEFPVWQEEEHYPRYRKQGVKRVAYILPEQYLASAKTRDASEVGFDLRNFSAVAEAQHWFQHG